ncbi:transferrin-binding protein-like solute binding protein [Sphingomonas sp.]|jgi:hypothetical protein|uniref:transferrin-binding protein-like solute binding protein n=1 Tax=Sphingomonas sp. TaxID=28214 RepID=UPI002DBC0767|nr:transferrin-binding protein-like solute binding protein [Sphingomonas sp.]HEU4969803.1 transferrin-binding protein-like solute binding protein [Sphingomonas sp.]
MRKFLGFVPLLALAACGGGGTGIHTAGGVAAPGGIGGGDTGSGGTTGTVNPGTGAGVTMGNGGSGSTDTATSFLNSNTAKTYNAIGAASSFSRSSGGGTLYQGDASTATTPLGTIAYDPRDGIFTIQLSDTKAGISVDVRTQDPGHRIDFDPARAPQEGVPNLNGFNYLEMIGSAVTDVTTFFYQRPGAATTYVTLAGYVRNSVPADPTATQTFERGAMVFGEQTSVLQVPTKGSASYTGGFIGAMINNPSYDTANSLPSTYQWVYGSSKIDVDFGKQSFALSLNGTVDNSATAAVTIPNGSSFTAAGGGTVSLVGAGGFTGSFTSACFVAACGSAGAVPIDFASVSPGSSTAGASSIDGAFYGPDAVNVGGSFRIVGGVPDQRVDLNGAFTGAKTK